MTYLLEHTDTHTTKLNFKMKFSGNTTLRPCLFTRPHIPNGTGKVDPENLPICNSLSCIGPRLRLWWAQAAGGWLLPQSGQSLSSYWSLYPGCDTTRNEFNYSWKGDGVSDAGPRRLIILSRMRWQVLCWHQTQLHPLTNDILMMNTNFSR